MKLCKCGKVLKNKEHCSCSPKSYHYRGTTNERGYSQDHRTASELYRKERPICERCLMLNPVYRSNASVAMHHITAISANESSRMNPNNWLAVCKACHDILEGDVIAGMAVKKWSNSNYEDKINEGLS